MDTDGKNKMPYEGDTSSLKKPVSSPDGHFKVYSNSDDRGWSLWVSEISNGISTQISGGTGIDWSPVWGENYVFFESNRSGNWDILALRHDDLNLDIKDGVDDGVISTAELLEILDDWDPISGIPVSTEDVLTALSLWVPG